MGSTFVRRWAIIWKERERGKGGALRNKELPRKIFSLPPAPIGDLENLLGIWSNPPQDRERSSEPFSPHRHGGRGTDAEGRVVFEGQHHLIVIYHSGSEKTGQQLKWAYCGDQKVVEMVPKKAGDAFGTFSGRWTSHLRIFSLIFPQGRV